MSIFVLPINTSHGTFLARYSENGLTGLNFPTNEKAPHISSAVTATIREWHKLTSDALDRVLNGKAVKDLPPLEMLGTEFQKSVWAIMLAIEPGKTLSYGDVAARLGKPKATRAVGSACGANPIPVLVPCHRVLAANKKLGGFSGGLDWKKTLLRIEGIEF
ncbi:MAG: cysteine methyltransferase [Verrucomicrobiales bacterium]|nr:cysteine methyltransferase [Verrucomicrobiales bacterium]